MKDFKDAINFRNKDIDRMMSKREPDCPIGYHRDMKGNCVKTPTQDPDARSVKATDSSTPKNIKTFDDKMINGVKYRVFSDGTKKRL